MSVIPLSFAPEMEELIIQGKKYCTTRREQHGKVGDVFTIRDRLYRICNIDEGPLLAAIDQYYLAEGFTNSYDFVLFWRGLESNRQPIHFEFVYLHFFAYVTDICPDFNLGCNSCISDLCPASEVCNHG